MSKVYTAHEMREAALVAETVEVHDQFCGHDMDEIAAMLRQAADMMEREAKGCPSLKANDGVTRYYDCRGRLIREEVRNDGV